MARRRPPHLIRWTGVVYRATSYDVPLRVTPNRRSGRWNIAWHDCTQYFCLDAEAPYTEVLRGENLRTESDAAMLRTILWQVSVEEGAIVDYSTFEKAESAGFSTEALVEDDHERCQAEAERLKTFGARGVLSPSAALPGSTNLTLFGPRVEAVWGQPVALASMLPVQRLAAGHPPPALTERVRYFGEPHALLVEYRAAQRRLFD